MSKLKLFGTDGIRGEANSKTMGTEIAVAVGRAVAYYSRNSKELPQIVIGKDTRQSGYMLETALASGITSMGVNVLKTGPLPTPGIGFITQSMRARLGIVISASHNPAEQNGIKLFGHDGFKLDPREEEKVEEIIFSKKAEKNLAKPTKIGMAIQLQDSDGRYVQYLKSRFPHRLNLEGIKIVLDTANGAGYTVAPLVFKELGAEVITVQNHPNGLNINKECGALHPGYVCRLTKKFNADIGITLDGDADRVLLSDEKGNLVNGDAILYISAKHLHSRNHLGQASVVGTIMTNFGLDNALKKEGISLARTDVGDHFVIDYMRKKGINLGGESCGHLIYLHHSPTGDGVLAALRILSIMKQTDKSLSQLTQGFKALPQKTINIHVNKKVPFNKIYGFEKTKKEVEKNLDGNGRLVLRYSGTEMVARIMVETKNEKTANIYCKKIADIIEKQIGRKNSG